MTTSSHNGEREFTGRHMLMIMLASFGVIIAVNALMAYLAIGSWTGLVVENSYVASQHFNEEQERARRQSGLGWKSKLVHQDGFLQFVVTNADDRFVADLNVTAKISVPAHEHRDHDVVLVRQSDGSYGAQVKLEPGQWQADVTARGDGDTQYRQIFRFLVEQGS